MEKGYFEKNIVVTPDYCDMAAGLSPLGAFTIFQGIASEHAEQIGVGFRAMGGARRILADGAYAGGFPFARIYYG